MKKEVGPRIGGRYVNAEGKKGKKQCPSAGIPGLVKKGNDPELITQKLVPINLIEEPADSDEDVLRVLEQAGY